MRDIGGGNGTLEAARSQLRGAATGKKSAPAHMAARVSESDQIIDAGSTSGTAFSLFSVVPLICLLQAGPVPKKLCRRRVLPLPEALPGRRLHLERLPTIFIRLAAGRRPVVFLQALPACARCPRSRRSKHRRWVWRGSWVCAHI